MIAPDTIALIEKLEEKRDQYQAARRNLYGLPVVPMESDTHPGKSALWMDNGLAGCGQVAISTGEFPCEQTSAIAAMANVAASIPWDDLIHTLRTLADKVEKLRADNARLRDALEPFASAAMGVETFDPDFPADGAAMRSSFDWYDKAQEEPLKRHSVRRRDLDRARAALKGTPND